MGGPGGQVLQNFQIYVVDPAMLLIFTVGLVVFLYGLVQFLWKLREGGGGHQEGVQHMVWGLVGMFIMVSVAGIINLVVNTIGADPTNPDVSRLQNVQPAGVQFQLFQQ